MTHTHNIHADENQVLFRRFILIAICIAMVGILLAQLIVATQRTAGTFRVYDRVGAWEQLETAPVCDDKSGDKMCQADGVIVMAG